MGRRRADRRILHHPENLGRSRQREHAVHARERDVARHPPSAARLHPAVFGARSGIRPPVCISAAALRRRDGRSQRAAASRAHQPGRTGGA